MDEDRKADLKFAYATLNRYNLWRKNYTKKMPEISDITKSISIASGAILDLFGVTKERDQLSRILAIAENELQKSEQVNEEHNLAVEEKEQEIRRLRSILAANKIKYAKKQ